MIKSINDRSYLEISNNYQFEVNVLTSSKKLQGKNSKVFVIDGFIESVSEIHHILYHFSTQEQTTPFLLVCRGASEDVLSTINVNNSRNAFSCHVLKVDFTIENVNLLVDIAVVSGSDVTSSLKGDLISSIKLDNSTTIDSFLITPTGLSIKNTKSKLRVAIHTSNLKKKLLNCNDVEKDFIHKRLKGLCANSIEIAIPDDINYFSRSQEIDEGIRLILSIMNNSFMLTEAASIYYLSLQNALKSISEIV